MKIHAHTCFFALSAIFAGTSAYMLGSGVSLHKLFGVMSGAFSGTFGIAGGLLWLCAREDRFEDPALRKFSMVQIEQPALLQHQGGCRGVENAVRLDFTTRFDTKPLNLGPEGAVILRPKWPPMKHPEESLEAYALRKGNQDVDCSP